MIDPEIKDEIEKQLALLPEDLQRRVLDYAVALASGRPAGTKGSDLLKFAGTNSAEDAEEMMKAIEEACENVDEDEW